MRPVLPALAVLAFASLALASGGRLIAAHGVRLTVPLGWHRVQEVQAAVDPRTLLVVGTAGAQPRSSQCQVASYRVPASGAVVVVIGWFTAPSGGWQIRPGRAPLKRLITVHRPSFECYAGRGASAQLVLRARAYQVNVLVGDHASKSAVESALAVGRSFALVR